MNRLVFLAVQGSEYWTGPSGLSTPLAEVMATKEQLFRPLCKWPPIRNAEHLTFLRSSLSSPMAADESVSLPVSGIRSLRAPSRRRSFASSEHLGFFRSIVSGCPVPCTAELVRGLSCESDF